MPNIEKIREFISKAREGLKKLDEQRAAIADGIRSAEELLATMERAGVKA